MKHVFILLLAVLLTALLSLPANAQSAAEGTWTAKNGDTIEAAFVKLEGTTVHLLLRNAPPSGKANVTIPLNELREADQKYITDLLHLRNAPPSGNADVIVPLNQLRKAEQKYMDDSARATAEAGGKLLELEIKGVKYRFRWCPAGSFTMGSLPTEKNRSDNETAHRVTLTKGFWMAETEVTQEQWESVFEDNNSPFKKEKGYSNPSKFKGANLPMEQIGWNDCQEFIAALKKLAPAGLPKGYKFALPTEAQWEYACRVGSQTAYCFGNDANKLGDYAWYSKNSEGKTHAVGTKKPNAWNLYDMHGNVWEWCADGYDDYPSSAVKDPVGTGSNRVVRDRAAADTGLHPMFSGRDVADTDLRRRMFSGRARLITDDTDSRRVFRGGAWNNEAENCRSAERDYSTPENRGDYLGFRLSLVSE